MRNILTAILFFFTSFSVKANFEQVDSTAIGDSLMQVFQFEKAREIYYSIHRFNPADADILYKLGYCHTQLGNYQDGIIYLKESFNIDTMQINVVMQLAIVHGKIGMDKEAADFFLRLIDLDPENGFYRKQAASSLIATGRKDEAIEQLKLAIDLNNLDMESYHLLAKLYFNSGNFELAKKTAHDGLSKNTRNVDLMFISSRVSFYFKDYDQVIELGNLATSINKDTSRWNLYMGYCHYFKNQYKDCVMWLNTSIEDKSIGEQGYTYLANAYIKLGDKVRAMESLDKAIESAKDNNLESNLQNKAILLHEMKNDKEALKLLEQSYSINYNPAILFRIGQFYYNKKQYNSAKNYLQSYQKSKDKSYQNETTKLLEAIKKIYK